MAKTLLVVLQQILVRTTHKRAERLVFFMRGGAEELVATVACACTQREVGAAGSLLLCKKQRDFCVKSRSWYVESSTI